jgi:ATP-dependent Clp protease ATP-binding subunit ClpC
MFEHFTDRARLAVVRAQEEARALGHDYIGTEHVLLGLVHDGGGLAAKALEALGISLAAVRQGAGEATGRGGQARDGHIPFTPRSKEVLRRALEESRALGHNYIGTEHLLLSLLRGGEDVATRVLTGLGADADSVREQVTRLLEEYRRRRGDQAG